MTKKQLAKMNKAYFLNELYQAGKKYINDDPTMTEGEFSRMVYEWNNAHNGCDEIDWENVYSEDGDFIGIRIEDETIYSDWYYRYTTQYND